MGRCAAGVEAQLERKSLKAIKVYYRDLRSSQSKLNPSIWLQRLHPLYALACAVDEAYRGNLQLLKSLNDPSSKASSVLRAFDTMTLAQSLRKAGESVPEQNLSSESFCGWGLNWPIVTHVFLAFVKFSSGIHQRETDLY